jgi:type II secretory pathway pseudopilin PulG
MSNARRRAMSIVETLVCVVVVATLTMTMLPALASIRDNSLNELSKANLMAIGQGRDQYAMENKDRIFTYTWRAGEAYTMPDGRSIISNTDQDAAARQIEEILKRRTGRITGQTKINYYSGRLPHRRYSHLILLDGMSDTDESFNSSVLFIDPADENLLTWHERPLEYRQGSGVPYAEGVPQGYDDGNGGDWADLPLLQRWPFGSSYQIVPHAWMGDGSENVYIPVSDSPHLFRAVSLPILGRRFMSEVAFPSMKVHIHEEFDYEQARYPYFAYDHARPEKLMFDGSINSLPSGDANDSVSPEDYDLNNPQDPSFYPVWTQRYVPLDTFPIPLGGFNDPIELNMRYRWTLFGLQGVDYD